jgi:hypothetical protein
MLLGSAYSKNIKEEVFLRLLNPGWNSVEKLKSSFYFFDDKVFREILYFFKIRQIITINLVKKEIYFDHKIAKMLKVIEKSKFINILEDFIKEFTKNQINNPPTILKECEFFYNLKSTEKGKKNLVLIDLGSELNLYLKKTTGIDFYYEIKLLGLNKTFTVEVFP